MTSTTTIPGYVAGTWDIDASHSEVSFSVRHLMVSKVRGRFDSFSGSITTGTNLPGSSAQVSIDATSINTANEQRDNHIRSADFFEVEKHPTWTFTSTSVEGDGPEFTLHGDLTIKGVTRPVALGVEVNGFSPDPWGGTRAGFSASTTINRNDFGVDIAMPIGADGVGVVVGDKIQIHLEIEGVLRTDA